MAYPMNELGKNGWEGLISAGEWVGCWSAGGGQLYYTAFVFLGFSSSFFFLISLFIIIIIIIFYLISVTKLSLPQPTGFTLFQISSTSHLGRGWWENDQAAVVAAKVKPQQAPGS